MRRLPLIRSAVKQVSWEGWFHANGLARPASPGMSFDRSFMAIAAAADGLGVCLESVLLAGPELASGRLVAPLAGRTVDLSEASHFLVYPKRNATRPAVAAFAAWITAEMTCMAG